MVSVLLLCQLASGTSLIMSCDPNTLLEQAKCFQCNGTGDLLPAMEIALLCRMRDGTTINCDPQTIINEASCIRGCIPIGAMSAVRVSLLCQILNL